MAQIILKTVIELLVNNVLKLFLCLLFASKVRLEEIGVTLYLLMLAERKTIGCTAYTERHSANTKNLKLRSQKFFKSE